MHQRQHMVSQMTIVRKFYPKSSLGFNITKRKRNFSLLIKNDLQKRRTEGNKDMSAWFLKQKAIFRLGFTLIP